MRLTLFTVKTSNPAIFHLLSTPLYASFVREFVWQGIHQLLSRDNVGRLLQQYSTQFPIPTHPDAYHIQLYEALPTFLHLRSFTWSHIRVPPFAIRDVINALSSLPQLSCVHLYVIASKSDDPTPMFQAVRGVFHQLAPTLTLPVRSAIRSHPVLPGVWWRLGSTRPRTDLVTVGQHAPPLQIVGDATTRP